MLTVKQVIVSTLSFLFLLLAYKLPGQVVIKGEVVDSMNNFVLLYQPINGCFNDQIADTLSLSETEEKKTFYKRVDIKQPMQLVVSVGPLYCPITVFPNDTISVTLNLDIWDTTWASLGQAISFTCRNKQGHEAFIKYNYPGLGMIMDFQNDLKSIGFWGGVRRVELFDSVLKKQSVRYNKLLQDKKITKQFYNFIFKAICEYLLANSISEVRTARQTSFEEKRTFISKMYEYYKIVDSDPVLYNNVYSRSIAATRFGYRKMLKENKADNFQNTVLIKKRNNFFLNGNLATWQEAPEHLQESFWAQSLLSLKALFSSSYDQKDVDTYLAFFPNGLYRKYLVPPHYGFSSWTGKDSLKASFITLENTDNLDSVLSKHFMNQNVLIDLWASWCMPCRQEFKYSKEIDAFCFVNNIKRLYISIDKIDGKEAFIKNIYAYQLAGSHFLMTYAVQEDLIKKVFSGKRDNLSIPRYVLINDRGKIIDADLVRPGTGNAFYKTILRKLYP